MGAEKSEILGTRMQVSLRVFQDSDFVFLASAQLIWRRSKDELVLKSSTLKPWVRILLTVHPVGNRLRFPRLILISISCTHLQCTYECFHSPLRFKPYKSF